MGFDYKFGEWGETAVRKEHFRFFCDKLQIMQSTTTWSFSYNRECVPEDPTHTCLKVNCELDHMELQNL